MARHRTLIQFPPEVVAEIDGCRLLLLQHGWHPAAQHFVYMGCAILEKLGAINLYYSIEVARGTSQASVQASPPFVDR